MVDNGEISISRRVPIADRLMSSHSQNEDGATMTNSLSKHGSRRILRKTLPVVLLISGVWLMAGCFYLPFPEHRSEHQAKDFRKLVGAIDSKKTIRPGAVTRAQVIALLGPPQFASDAPPYRVYNQPASTPSEDHSAIGYILYTESNAWVYPLCFTATPGTTTRYELRLVFNKEDVLDHWNLEHPEQHGNFLNAPPFLVPPFHDAPELFPVPRGE